MKLSTQIIDHLKNPPPSCSTLKGMKVVVCYAMRLACLMTPNLVPNELPRKKGCRYALENRGGKALGSFAEIHAEKMLYDAVKTSESKAQSLHSKWGFLFEVANGTGTLPLTMDN